MSPPDPETSPIPAPEPPGRPRFEFRQRPSEVITQRAGSVVVAYGLWTAAAAVGLLAALAMLIDLDGVQGAVRATVDRDFPNESAVTRDRAVAAATGVLIGGAFVVSVLTGITATAMRAGRGAARVVLVLLIAVVVVEIVLAVDVVSPLALGLLVVNAALGAAGTVMMYLPDANNWFAIKRR
ncbi:hypothetical protein I4I73_28825 [Pseudonocardia sp. KRD-184]|uniref:Uncharacterized protein n=1 Tax=Pseudonocardia oceani TaxID=2792013 RepID=A0ABS6U7F1_9PSEU|nr:hypothetical protein [Pseudonocardia oceani]MBW0094389.1 hypothetical protein [Pseudonocardia oceani]MBW0099989.1 hypothetical protein [Pseudonocardia oceani]MBW0112646.1 hypothetical protein [Pseudonocardia oceani]MBW0124139.1 hypothetical protein [Pseudonocardia oceani]MBW0128135.1 hypothetical protein [Pseudonocardia oceani]